MWTDGQALRLSDIKTETLGHTDRHDQANSLFSQFCECAHLNLHCFIGVPSRSCLACVTFLCWRVFGTWGQTLLGCWRLLSSTYSLSTFLTWRGFPPFYNLSTYNAVTNKCASNVEKKRIKEINKPKQYIARRNISPKFSVLLKYDPVLLDEWCPTLRNGHPVYNVQSRCFIGYSKFEDEAICLGFF
jgi:hypothetical protein